MNDNQTIDGVSRKSLEQALKLAAVFDDGCDGADAESARGVVWILRALLDAPACSACNETGRAHEPDCEPGACTACLEKPVAQPQPQPVARVEIGADRNAALTVTNDDWLRSLKDRGVHQIVSLYAEQPAPVAVALPARPRADEEEYERMTDYEKGLLHGSIELWDKIDELKRLNPSL